ncbi:MAG: thiamine biosynthesis lipoprotein [Pseudomonadota bacterium]
MHPEQAPVLQRRLRPLLGCYVEVAVAALRPGAQADAAIDAAYATMQRVHDSLGFHSPASELTRLNQARGRAVRLTPLALRVLRLARAMTTLSAGAFNCTVGGALVSAARLPDHGGGPYLQHGEAADLILTSGRAQLRRPVLVTLDGIAKGYAVDAAIACLKRSGVLAGWVNAGGDLRVFGDCTLPLRIRSAGAPAAATWGVRNAAVASSGGQPGDAGDFPGLLVDGSGTALAEAGCVSVIATRAWRADALTKVAACTTGRHRDELLRRLGGRLVAQPEARAA